MGTRFDKQNALDKDDVPRKVDGVSALKTILILGLGNDILTDDAVGLIVARELQSRFAQHPAVEVKAVCEMGLGLLDYIIGHAALVVVDSVQTGRVPLGSVHVIEEKDLPTLPGMSPHFLGVGEILTLGRRMSYHMPVRVKIFAIEVADAATVSEQLSPVVAGALPRVVDQVAALVSQWCLELR